MTKILEIPNKVVCADAGCEGCPHSEPHKWMDVDSHCDSDEEGNCPGCIPLPDKGGKQG